MPRQRSPNRDEAKRMWLESGGKMPLKDIAAALGVLDNKGRKWKSQDNWERELKGNAPIPAKGNAPKPGAPLGSRNAVGNRGGAAPKGNTNRLTHGAYSQKLFNELLDEDTVSEIMDCPIGDSLDEIEREIRELRLIKTFYLTRITQVRKMYSGGMGVHDAVKTSHIKRNGQQGEGTITTRTMQIDDLLQPLYTELSRTQKNLSTAINNRETIINNLRRLNLEALRIQATVPGLGDEDEVGTSNFEEAMQAAVSEVWPDAEDNEND
jgi:uncharacterized protein YjcR